MCVSVCVYSDHYKEEVIIWLYIGSSNSTFRCNEDQFIVH